MSPETEASDAPEPSPLRGRVADAILEGLADAVVVCDHEGKISFWNPGAERIFGYAHAEAVGRSLDLIVPERLRERHWQGYTRVMRTGQSRYGSSDVLSVPALRKDGTTISVEFTVYPLSEDGRMIGIAAVMRDSTKRFNEMRSLKRKLDEAAKAGAGSI
jgi:PAS domain S-box-containing protein